MQVLGLFSLWMTNRDHFKYSGMRDNEQVNLEFHSLPSQNQWHFMVYHLIPHLLYLEGKLFSKQAMPMTRCLEWPRC